MTRIRNGLMALALGLTPLALSGCGFTPLYATQGLNQALGSIAVETPQTRTGYLLRESLNDSLAVRNASVPRYDLKITLKDQRYSIGLSSNDIASRYEISNQVAYTLTDRQTKDVVHKGNFIEATTYDAGQEQPYTGIVGQQDAQERAAKGIAQKITADLSVFFARKAKAPQANP